MTVLRRQVQDLLKKGIIRHSVSPYSIPISLVPKGETDFSPVLDYRALNKMIKIESVPLPDFHSCLHWFSGANVYTTLDLNTEYNRTPLSEKSRPLTAFATDWNIHELFREPLGIATGAQVLTSLLVNIFSDIRFRFVYNYLDDFVIYSSSLEEHLVHFRKVFTHLRNEGLTVKPFNVKFATHIFFFWRGTLFLLQGLLLTLLVPLLSEIIRHSEIYW